MMKYIKRKLISEAAVTIPSHIKNRLRVWVRDIVVGYSLTNTLMNLKKSGRGSSSEVREVKNIYKREFGSDKPKSGKANISVVLDGQQIKVRVEPEISRQNVEGQYDPKTHTLTLVIDPIRVPYIEFMHRGRTLDFPPSDHAMLLRMNLRNTLNNAYRSLDHELVHALEHIYSGRSAKVKSYSDDDYYGSQTEYKAQLDSFIKEVEDYVDSFGPLLRSEFDKFVTKSDHIWLKTLKRVNPTLHRKAMKEIYTELKKRKLML